MSKVLSVRLNNEDRKRLEEIAEKLDLGPSVLAKLLLHSSLANLEELDRLRATGRLPIALLSELLAPIARSKEYSERDAQKTLANVRKKRWKALQSKTS